MASLGSFKMAGIFLVFLFAIGGIVLNIGSSAIHWSKTGDSGPLIESTAGRIAGADLELKITMDDLIANGKTMSSKELKHAQDDVISSLMIILILYTLGFSLVKWKVGLGVWNANYWFWTFLGLTVIFLISAVGYVWWATGTPEFPQGIITFLTNMDAVIIPGEGFVNPLDIAGSELINTTNTVLNTTNSSLSNVTGGI